MSKKRDHLIRIESEMNKVWEGEHLFEQDAKEEKETDRETYMATFPYPYMNGRLHLGHAFTFLKSDVQVYYQRMLGSTLASFETIFCFPSFLSRLSHPSHTLKHLLFFSITTRKTIFLPIIITHICHSPAQTWFCFFFPISRQTRTLPFWLPRDRLAHLCSRESPERRDWEVWKSSCFSISSAFWTKCDECGLFKREEGNVWIASLFFQLLRFVCFFFVFVGC